MTRLRTEAALRLVNARYTKEDGSEVASLFEQLIEDFWKIEPGFKPAIKAWSVAIKKNGLENEPMNADPYNRPKMKLDDGKPFEITMRCMKKLRPVIKRIDKTIEQLEKELRGDKVVQPQFDRLCKRPFLVQGPNVANKKQHVAAMGRLWDFKGYDNILEALPDDEYLSTAIHLTRIMISSLEHIYKTEIAGG